VDQPLGLRSLAGARRPKKNYSHRLFRPPWSPADSWKWTARRTSSLFEPDSAQTSLASVAGESGVRFVETQTYDDGSCFPACITAQPWFKINHARSASVATQRKKARRGPSARFPKFVLPLSIHLSRTSES